VTYRRIELPGTVPREVQAIVRTRVDLFCADIHAMLRLPLPVLGIAAGCNFALAEILCALVSGLSRVFVDRTLGSEAAFRGVLAHYPNENHPLALSEDEFVDELYETYRCNFAHSLGINMPDVKRGQKRKVQSLRHPTKVLRLVPMAIPGYILSAIEADEVRPRWLPPTIYRQDGVQKLCVESLYWGVRQLVRRLCADDACVSFATRFLREEVVSESDASSNPDYFALRQAPQHFEVMSSSSMVTSTTGSFGEHGYWQE
jgi:hypothetical protein